MSDPSRNNNTNHRSMLRDSKTDEERSFRRTISANNVVQGDNGTDNEEEQEKSSSSVLHWFGSPTTVATSLMVVLLGCASMTVFVWIGVSSAKSRQQDFFLRDAADYVRQIESVVADYVNVASLVHNRCRDRNFSRQDFRNLYEYVIQGGGDSSQLDLKAIQFDPIVYANERAAYEQEALEYYNQSYPHIKYRGFVGFETEIPSMLEPRSEQEFYYPIHYMEPIIGNEAAIDLDYYSHISRRATLQYCMDNGLPAITDRLVLVKDPGTVSRCGAIDPAYGVVLMHPGVNLTVQDDVWPRDLSSIVICIPSLLGTAADNHAVSSAVYVFDTSGEDEVYLGGVRADVQPGQKTALTFLPEISIEELRKQHKLFQKTTVDLTNKQWAIVVVASNGAYEPVLTYVILGGVMIFLASICLGLWVCNSAYRMKKIAQMRAEADSEKALLILENAREATRVERELNDFVAHEVRNPVSAAMTACSFVKAAVNKNNPLADEESRAITREDVNIIDNSLTFVSDLLRNMLDMHRASSKQLVVDLVSTNVLLDIMEPVGGMLYRRGDRVQVSIDCHPNLFVMTDSLRLKQVMLNLGRNSSKFTSKGFIRLAAKEVNGLVQLSVEDSGSGVPEGKQDQLFSKFQESLDVLNQGTGIGLFLCKNLVELLGGRLYLDDQYDSGIPGCKGSRFVVDLMAPQCATKARSNEDVPEAASATYFPSDRPSNLNQEMELPSSMSVLFVDDDAMLRKLFVRAIKRTAPGWICREAACGESALLLVETDSFDLIFMDQYMASVEKQLLGTEAVTELRSRGVNSIICGLSANDTESEFLDAGADAFVVKPFPCKPELLRRELLRILSCAGRRPAVAVQPTRQRTATALDAWGSEQAYV